MSYFILNLVVPIHQNLKSGEAIMKKKTILVNQPDKTETIKSEEQPCQNLNSKMYRDHTRCDHLHGRVNKFPFGSGHGPMSF
nr:hypothetical protein [Mucilaginibacter sp. FT3.2]